MNVVEAAIKRYEFLIKTNDHVVVSFSGGKDSLVSMLCLREAYKKLGIKKNLNAYPYSHYI